MIIIIIINGFSPNGQYDDDKGPAYCFAFHLKWQTLYWMLWVSIFSSNWSSTLIPIEAVCSVCWPPASCNSLFPYSCSIGISAKQLLRIPLFSLPQGFISAFHLLWVFSLFPKEQAVTGISCNRSSPELLLRWGYQKGVAFMSDVLSSSLMLREIVSIC